MLTIQYRVFYVLILEQRSFDTIPSIIKYLSKDTVSPPAKPVTDIEKKTPSRYVFLFTPEKLSVSFFISPLSAYRYLKPKVAAAEGLVEERNRMEKNKLFLSAGVSLNYSVSKLLQLQTGVRYLKLGEKINSNIGAVSNKYDYLVIQVGLSLNKRFGRISISLASELGIAYLFKHVINYSYDSYLHNNTYSTRTSEWDRNSYDNDGDDRYNDNNNDYDRDGERDRERDRDCDTNGDWKNQESPDGTIDNKYNQAIDLNNASALMKALELRKTGLIYSVQSIIAYSVNRSTSIFIAPTYTRFLTSVYKNSLY